MADTPRIVAFAGSTREGSFNRKLVRIAAESARSAGADVTVVELREHPLPLYDADLETAQGWPENAKKLREIFLQHDGFMIASPEYNNGISGVLKNMIDWVSRPLPGVPRYDSFLHKPAVIMSASGTQFGGVRGLMMLKITLSAVSMIVLPNQVMIPRADQAFDEYGKIKDPKTEEQIQKLGAVIVKYTALLRDQS